MHSVRRWPGIASYFVKRYGRCISTTNSLLLPICNPCRVQCISSRTLYYNNFRWQSLNIIATNNEHPGIYGWIRESESLDLKMTRKRAEWSKWNPKPTENLTTHKVGGLDSGAVLIKELIWNDICATHAVEGCRIDIYPFKEDTTKSLG
jgi:hypothetical protein